MVVNKIRFWIEFTQYK